MLRLLVCTLALAVSLNLQAQSAPKALQPDDPDLFHAFFLDSAAQKQAPVTAADAPTLSSSIAAINQDLDTLNSQLRAFLNRMQSRRQTPSPRTLQGFEACRHRIDVRGIQRLRLQMPNPAWVAVRAYVNGSYRQQVNRAAGAH